MKDRITRRDFINGSLAFASAALLPSWVTDCARHVSAEPAGYPPAWTGLRGSTSSAFEAAHQLAWAGHDFGQGEDTKEVYDLVVVGAGISGLSAARFYQQQFGMDRRILILDNHDDFGGHARRNEFAMNPRMRLCYGGSQSLEDPYSYSEESRALLNDLGVELRKFEESYDLDFFKRHGLADVTYFSSSRFGKDKVVPSSMAQNTYTLPGLLPGFLSADDAVREMPLADEARRQLAVVYKDSLRALERVSEKDRRSLSYFDFLRKYLNINHPDVFAILRPLSADETGIAADALSVAEAVKNELPGFSPRRRRKESDRADLYLHHFPDGNASLARLLVRKLMPHTAAGSGMDDIILSQMHYDALDRAGERVRLRLNSTVVRVAPGGGAQNLITYVSKGKAFAVKARDCILACYNAVIPHLVPELPEKQKAALKNQVKAPFVYTTVVLKNWKSLKALGIGAAYCPGNLHHIVLANLPVNLGGYRATVEPEEPMALTLIHVPLSDKTGASPHEQFRDGRRRLLSMSFEDFEKEIRSHLSGMLGPGGFQADRDIHAITVNRWGHGYAYSGSDLFDEESAVKVARRARKPFGRIAIANSDSGAMASVDTAMDEAFRAVGELSSARD